MQLLWLIQFVLRLIQPSPYEGDENLGTPEIITRHGYPVEPHVVITGDGYVLKHFRIPFGKKSGKSINKPVVLLLHGIQCTSSHWVLGGPEDSLGFILADAGYDVWIMNSRGNDYSSQHTTLKTSSREFWNFSWHELGIYDLPDTIDYILNYTGLRSLAYIGHSQGTTAFYVMAALKQEYQAKVSRQISLSPVVFRTNTKNLIYTAFGYINKFGLDDQAVALFGSSAFFPTNEDLHLLAAIFCKDYLFTNAFCAELFYVIMGRSPKELKTDLLSTFFTHFPAGCSIKQLIHSGQLINCDKFRRYDYGPQTNLLYYGKREPPEYNLKNITVPSYLFYAENDDLSVVQDVERLKTELPRIMLMKYLAGFAHMDFLMGKDAKQEVFNVILKIVSGSI